MFGFKNAREKAFEAQQNDKDYEFRQGKSDKDHEFKQRQIKIQHAERLQKQQDKAESKQLRRNQRKAYEKAEFTGDAGTDFARKTLQIKYKIARGAHISGAVASWLLSASYWFLLLILSSASLQRYEVLIGQTVISVYYTVGILGGMIMITVLELTKFSAQEENTPPKVLVVYLIFISLLTTTGKFMNDASGAKDFKDSQSLQTQNVKDVALGKQKTFSDNRWAFDDYPNANTVIKVQALRDAYLNKTAIRPNGVSAGFTNSYALSKGYASYKPAIERQLGDFGKRIDALRAYYSASTDVDSNGVAKTGISTTSTIDPDKTGDMMIDAIADRLGWTGLTTTLIFYLLIAFALELAGRFNGRKARLYKLQLDGQDRVIDVQILSNKTGYSPEAISMLLDGQPQQVVYQNPPQPVQQPVQQQYQQAPRSQPVQQQSQQAPMQPQQAYQQQSPAQPQQYQQAQAQPQYQKVKTYQFRAEALRDSEELIKLIKSKNIDAVIELGEHGGTIKTAMGLADLRELIGSKPINEYDIRDYSIGQTPDWKNLKQQAKTGMIDREHAKFAIQQLLPLDDLRVTVSELGNLMINDSKYAILCSELDKESQQELYL